MPSVSMNSLNDIFRMSLQNAFCEKVVVTYVCVVYVCLYIYVCVTHT